MQDSTDLFYAPHQRKCSSWTYSNQWQNSHTQ